MNIIFARTRYVYESYAHYWELVRLSNFETCYIDEIQWDSDNIYFVSPLNGELPNPLPPHRCRVIWLNIERVSYYNEPGFGRPDIKEIWIADKNWAAQVGAKFVPIGSHSGLGFYDPNKRFDIALQAYMTPRRLAVKANLGQYTFAPNGFALPNPDLAASRLYLVPYQDDPPQSMTPLRFCIAAAYHLPLVYELAADPYPFINGIDFLHPNYGDIVSTVHQALANPQLQDMGETLYNKLCVETDFRRSIENAL